MQDTITFEGTSRTNLTILQLEDQEDKYNPVPDIDALIRRWIPFQASLQNLETIPELACVKGSSISNEVDSFVTLQTHSGLIGTVLTAYNLHQNLQIRPDDIWITILGQFSAYVNGRAEELRHKIVSHGGQMELTVLGAGSVCTADYATMTRGFLDEISTHAIDGDSLKEWFLPGFSTTTVSDEVTASATAMCSFQAYFTYEYGLICGIPEITLLGSVEDWQQLRDKLEHLVEFDGEDKLLSTEWVPLLRRVLDNFVESAKNGSQNNIQFWDQIVQYYEAFGGCFMIDELTGWLSVFTFFDGEGQKPYTLNADNGLPWPRRGLSRISHNVVSCPAQVNDNGAMYNATLYAGQMAFDYLEDIEATAARPPSVQGAQNEGATMRLLRPRNDWALAIQQRDIAFSSATIALKPDGVVQLLRDPMCPSITADNNGYWTEPEPDLDPQGGVVEPHGSGAEVVEPQGSGVPPTMLVYPVGIQPWCLLGAIILLFLVRP
jgi:hypothetical protein